MTRTLVVCLALGSSALQAQQSPFVGAWRLSYPAGMRIENGVRQPIMANGTLTIEAQGDSLIGMLETDPTPGLEARPPARLSAARATGTVTFISRTEAKLNMNGVERSATAISTWALRVEGDSLSGNVTRTLEGMNMSPQEALPVSGTRRKPGSP